MITRLISVFGEDQRSSSVKHYEGLPPELTGGRDSRTELGPTVFLVIDEKQDGVFLFRYDRKGKGKCVGDTWQMSVEDAKRQAAMNTILLNKDGRIFPNTSKTL